MVLLNCSRGSCVTILIIENDSGGISLAKTLNPDLFEITPSEEVIICMHPSSEW